MKIAVIGGTGMVGAATVAEAAARGHEVVSATRSGHHAEGAAQDVTLELGDTAGVVTLVNSVDATVIAVSTGRTGGSTQPTIDAHGSLLAAHPTGRLVVVGGAGSLLDDAGRRIVDDPAFPDSYRGEALASAEILDLYRATAQADGDSAQGDPVAWTFLSPAPMFTTEERTSSYVEGGDHPAGATVSVANFAVALVDEAEADAHRGQRWTVANA